MSVICVSCGFNNPAGMQFCGKCGSRFAVIDNQPKAWEGGDCFGGVVKTQVEERFPQPVVQATGQRRNVTVMFADLADYTHISEKIDPEDLYEIILQFSNMLANIIHKYNGTVDKFTGGGLMALFGAPITHENNAERAIHAALDMQSGLRDLNENLKEQFGIELQMHIGMNSGTVIVGSMGSDTMMDYTAVGETVNLAQRLDAVAGPGNILVSESVFRQTRIFFDYEIRPSLELKGITQPVTGYQFAGIKNHEGLTRGLDGLRSAMVGRDLELRQLVGAVQSLVGRNSGSFVLIQGDAGIGKTRLVSEAISMVSGKFINILKGRSLTYRRSVAYWMFQELLRHYLGVTPDTPEQQVWAKLSKQVIGLLGKQGEDVLPYLAYLLNLQPSNQEKAERLASLDANQLRQQIFMAVRNWLIAEAQYCPLMLVMDDLHWADDASLELLRFLLDTIHSSPVLICGITRPTEDGILAKLVERVQTGYRDQYLEIRLESLAPAQSEQLLQQLMAIPDFPSELQEEIISRAAGIPFYLEEILRMLMDESVIVYDNGNWRLQTKTDISNLGVPDNLQSLILTRFDRLDLESRKVLNAASVIGREFSLPVLSVVIGQDEHSIQKILNYLIDRAFIELCSSSSPSDFCFRHVLTSDAIYSTLLRRERSELHGKIGSAIETIYPDRVSENVYLLARHYSWGTRKEKALHYAILAGEKASRDHLTAQAREYYELAADMLPKVQHQPSQARKIHVGLGDVLVFVGEYSKAHQQYRNAQALVDIKDENDIEGYVALLRKISTTYERQGEFEQALKYLEDAQKIILEIGVALPVEGAKNLSNIGWINFRRGELELAEKHLSEALALVENTTQYGVIASIYNRLGGIYFQKDDLEQAGNFVRKSLVLREEMGDIGAVARSYNNLGLLAWKRGDWDDALDDFSHSIALNKNLGDVEAMIFLHNNIGLLQTDKGNLEIAREHLEQSLARSQQIGHIALEGETYLHFSRYWLAAEEWEKSLFYSNRALEIFCELGAQERLVDLYASIGEAWFGLDDLNKALEAAQSAQSILKEHFEQNAPSLGKARVLRLFGNIKRKNAQYIAAMNDLRGSIKQFTDLKNPLELGRAYCDMVILERKLGNMTNARILAREAHFVFRKLGAKLDMEKAETLTQTFL